jgi:hypothetical protein
MFDVFQAVEWSHMVLKDGGLFYMDDFIGASRFQFSDKQLDIATKVRQAFHKTSYLLDQSGERYISERKVRPNKEKLIEVDPSEAADSERIIDAIKKYFPDAKIKSTGGVAYHLALSDIVFNFDANIEQDQILLDLIMLIDELCIDLGESVYGVALAIKKIEMSSNTKKI